MSVAEGDVEAIPPHMVFANESLGESGAEGEGEVAGRLVVVKDVGGGGVEERRGLDEGYLRRREVSGEETDDVCL